mmetsp:Transcript_19076/g.39966  ORF Transcript_19076/g.39966 Transcript_19076/m.39966 type:complete len:94 (+) Transcript_19076:494-775(+)
MLCSLLQRPYLKNIVHTIANWSMLTNQTHVNGTLAILCLPNDRSTLIKAAASFGSYNLRILVHGELLRNDMVVPTNYSTASNLPSSPSVMQLT